jgi:hypothetical protein
LTGAELDKLKAYPPSSLGRVFGFVQHEAVRVIYRREFYSLGTCSDASKEFPFRGRCSHLLGIWRDANFRSNIGRGTYQADHILSAHLRVIDEVPMLTPWLANRVSLTLRSIYDDPEKDFGA